DFHEYVAPPCGRRRHISDRPGLATRPSTSVNTLRCRVKTKPALALKGRRRFCFSAWLCQGYSIIASTAISRVTSSPTAGAYFPALKSLRLMTPVGGKCGWQFCDTRLHHVCRV